MHNPVRFALGFPAIMSAMDLPSTRVAYLTVMNSALQCTCVRDTCIGEVPPTVQL